MMIMHMIEQREQEGQSRYMQKVTTSPPGNRAIFPSHITLILIPGYMDFTYMKINSLYESRISRWERQRVKEKERERERLSF